MLTSAWTRCLACLFSCVLSMPKCHAEFGPRVYHRHGQLDAELVSQSLFNSARWQRSTLAQTWMVFLLCAAE
jgi:hypothetical protein